MNEHTSPPRLARRLLERTLPGDVRDDIIGDLEEVFRERCGSRGVLRARLWYWREAVGFAGRFAAEPSRIRGADRRSRARPSGSGGRGGGGSALSWLDVKLGLRMLVKYPGLTAVGMLGITVAVTLAAAWFEFGRDIANPRLPVEGADRIVGIRNWDVEAGRSEPRLLHDFTTWRTEVGSVQDLGGAAPMQYRVAAADGRSETVGAARVTASAFRLLGITPVLGRPLLESDEAPAAPLVAVLGYDVWRRMFDGEVRIVGRTIRVGTEQATVVGVMPEGFAFPSTQEVWLPLRDDPVDYARREGPAMLVFGRLAPGATREEAQAELNAIGARAAAEFPETHEMLRPRVGDFVDAGREIAIMVSGVNLAFVLLLVVICANVATLVYARTATREAEIAVRTALGAGRRRIVMQLFVEALLLTAVAAGIGLVVAAWGIERGMALFWEVQQSRAPFWFDAGLSVSTAVYVGALALLGAVVIGAVPALKATGRRIQPQLALLGSGGSRLRFGAASTTVIVVQVALCVALLPLAAVRALDMLPGPDVPGFSASTVISGELVVEIDAPGGTRSPQEREAVRERIATLHDEARRRLEGEPGVAAVTFADRLPGMNHVAERVRLESDVLEADSAVVTSVRILAVDPGFFETMNARVIAGRGFQPSDLESEVGAMVVGRSFAEEVLRGRNAVGQRLRFPNRQGAEAERWHQIVGVVEDPPMVEFGAGEYVGAYRPLPLGERASIQLYVRADAATVSALMPRIRSAVAAIDRDLAIDGLASLEEIWRPVRRSDRFFVIAIAAVCGIGLLLCLAGIYALMSFTVAQRSREIAIRAALGAHPGRLIRAIFARAFIQIGAGAAVGALVVSVAANAFDGGPKIVGGVTALVLLVGLTACVLPAARALRIEPAEVLRDAG